MRYKYAIHCFRWSAVVFSSASRSQQPRKHILTAPDLRRHILTAPTQHKTTPNPHQTSTNHTKPATTPQTTTQNVHNPDPYFNRIRGLCCCRDFGVGFWSPGGGVKEASGVRGLSAELGPEASLDGVRPCSAVWTKAQPGRLFCF